MRQLYKLVEAYSKSETFCGAYGNIKFVSDLENGPVVRKWKSSNFYKYKLWLGWMPPHTGMIVSRDVFKKIGGFKDQYKISGDYEFILRLLTSDFKLVYVNIFVSNMLVGGVSTKLRFSNLKLKFKEDILALKSNGFHFPIISAVSKRLLKLEQFLSQYGIING